MKTTKKVFIFAVFLASTVTNPGIFSTAKVLLSNKFIRDKIIKPALIGAAVAAATTIAVKFSQWFFSDPMNLKLVHMQTQIYQQRKSLPPEAKTKLRSKLKELQISRNPYEFADFEPFIKAVLAFPWGIVKEPQENIDVVKKALDANIFGMKEPKECILDALFSYQQGFFTSFPPICLVGPPGVGKTAFATTLATALNLPQVIISAAGMNDIDSFFRGFSRTYKGSVPGFFVNTFSLYQCLNPVIVIDEIDKEAKGNHKGTIQNILLQILDPVQNKEFRDTYLDLPIDVSKAFYILTANDLKNIIEPLQDRLLIIEIPNYSKTDIETMAHGIVWQSISGSKHIPQTIKKQMIAQVFSELKKEPSIRTIKKNLSRTIVRWLRNNHKKESMTW